MDYKQKVQNFQNEFDQELGKMKRLLLQGWVSKPACYVPVCG